MRPSERREMIRKDNTDFSLTRHKISRSSIYCTPVVVNAETLKLMHEIDRVFTKYPVFGSRQIAAYLPRSGFPAGRHRLRRLMNIMGLQALDKGPNTRKKHPQHRIYRSPLCLNQWRAKCCPGGGHMRWTPALTWRRWKTPSPDTAGQRSWIRTKAANIQARVGSPR